MPERHLGRADALGTLVNVTSSQGQSVDMQGLIWQVEHELNKRGLTTAG
jgi:hypothetical protein